MKSNQHRELCVPTKLKDDGVHVDYICKDCGQTWGEEMLIPACKNFFNAQVQEAIKSRMKTLAIEVENIDISQMTYGAFRRAVLTLMRRTI